MPVYNKSINYTQKCSERIMLLGDAILYVKHPNTSIFAYEGASINIETDTGVTSVFTYFSSDCIIYLYKGVCEITFQDRILDKHFTTYALRE